jgi:hypothetical protein
LRATAEGEDVHFCPRVFSGERQPRVQLRRTKVVPLLSQNGPFRRLRETRCPDLEVASEGIGRAGEGFDSCLSVYPGEAVQDRKAM